MAENGNFGRRAMTRRSFLGASGGFLAGASLLGLAGCGEESGESAQAIRIPDTDVEVPEDGGTFRWMDNGDLKARFWEEFFPLYEEAHPNITIEYDALAGEGRDDVILLGIRNGTAHDVFRLPTNVTGAQAVRQGWVAPLDDVIPDFEAWKAAFPPNSFFDGVHTFDGKTYTFPLTSGQQHPNMLLYNKRLLNEAGYDFSSEPPTWDEYREAARKITEQGNGSYYGVAIEGGQSPRFLQIVSSLAHMAGAPTMSSLIDPETGEYAFTSDEYIAAIELLMALKSDGSLFPGSNSLTAPEAWARVAGGNAAMVTGGPWVVVGWQQESPDFDFGIAEQPGPNSGEPVPLGYSSADYGSTNTQWLYAGSDFKAVAGDIFSYLGSVEGQIVWSTLVAIGTAPLFPEVANADGPEARRAVELANEIGLRPDSQEARRAAELAGRMVVLPDPVVRNPDIGMVNQELEVITPDFGQTVQSIFVGEIEDPLVAMRDLKDRYEAELERAIEAARANGAEVSRDDWVFPNWNPREDYTQEKYAEL